MTRWLPPGRGGYRGTGDGTRKRPASSDSGGVSVVDDEKFCGVCFAGVDSSQHRDECVRPLDRAEDEALHWEAEHVALYRCIAQLRDDLRAMSKDTRYDDSERKAFRYAAGRLNLIPWNPKPPSSSGGTATDLPRDHGGG